jgi:very-short-patch-repair endonuclease
MLASPFPSNNGAMGSSALRSRKFYALADTYGGVLSRDLLRQFGADRNVISRQVADARWSLVGRQTVAMHTAALNPLAQAWRAVWEVGGDDVALDGVSSLQLAGLSGFDAPVIDVSIPWQARVGDVPGVRIHRACRSAGDVIGPGPPRVATPLATVRAAHWASSDRQAALLLVLPIQQRLLTPDRLLNASRTDRVRGRRALIRRLVDDIVDGSHSLGELDFARMCRRRGLPTPDRQVLVASRTGRIYLDVCWTWLGLIVEIDGSGHREGLQITDDNFRQNVVTMKGTTVLRYGLLALRLHPEEVLDQVCEAHQTLTAQRSA